MKIVFFIATFLGFIAAAELAPFFAPYLFIGMLASGLSGD